jgi:hypothetical protein
MRPMATKAPSPDFRSDKMDSLEGKAIARGRFLVFWDSIDPELLEETSTPSGVVCDALTEHLRQWPSDDLVFTAPDGGPVRLASWRSRFFKRAVDSAGVAPLRVHDLRHTAVSLCFAAGASPREIASRAGHTSVSIVLDRYGHLLPGSENRVNDELDRLAATALITTPRTTATHTDDADKTRHDEAERPVALRIVRARSAHAEDRHNSVESENRPLPGAMEWAQRDSNPRPQPCEGCALTS